MLSIETNTETQESEMLGAIALGYIIIVCFWLLFFYGADTADKE